MKKHWGLIFFLLMVLASIAVFFWSTYFYLGYLVVESEAPFLVEIEGVKEVDCQDSPCEIKLRPGNYELTLKKENYFDDHQEVNIQWWKKKEIRAQFFHQPYLEVEGELDEINVPKNSRGENYEDNREEVSLNSLLREKDLSGLNNFSGKIERISFSPEGESFLIFLESGVRLYDSEKGELIGAALSSQANFAWDIQGDKILFLEKEKELHKLFLWDLSGKKVDLITSFESLEGPIISFSALAQRALIVDKGKDLYLIDLEKKSKEKIPNELSFGRIKWSRKGDHIALEGEKEGIEVVYLMEVGKKKVFSSPIFTSFDLIAWGGVFSTSPEAGETDEEVDILVFVTEEVSTLEKGEIKEFISQTKEILSLEEGKNKGFLIYIPEKDHYRLIDVFEAGEINPRKIEFSADLKNILIVDYENKLRKLVLRE